MGITDTMEKSGYNGHYGVGIADTMENGEYNWHYREQWVQLTLWRTENIADTMENSGYS